MASRVGWVCRKGLGLGMSRAGIPVSRRRFATAAASDMHSEEEDVPTLYRKMLHTAKEFEDYNIREYALRRIRAGFHEHKHETDSEMINKLLSDARDQLHLLERQTAISKMYTKHASVMEKLRS